ncbi:hypothetical protein BDF21DRAFT_349641 [Thamnidium elegans]|nr:hypothetical protein BDF21DRAFT_349641 [Thamnidium elegans]
MLIGDRDHGFGSAIKRHQRFSDSKKQKKKQGKSTPTLITNEYNSSQTCLFCFNKLSHPVSTTANKISAASETFICMNSSCPTVFKTVCRDKVFALAIGLAGIFFGSTFRASRAQFSDSTLHFLNKK